MPNINILVQPRLKEVLAQVQNQYQGIYGTRARSTLQLLSTSTLSEFNQRTLITEWRGLKSCEHNELQEQMTVFEQQNPVLEERLKVPLPEERIARLEQSLAQLNQELATERTTTQEALRTGQEWHERQKAEIIAEWKTKYTNLLNARKEKVRQEINLIREVLNE